MAFTTWKSASTCDDNASKITTPGRPRSSSLNAVPFNTVGSFLPGYRHLSSEGPSDEQTVKNGSTAHRQCFGGNETDTILETFQGQVSTGLKNVISPVVIAFPATTHSPDKPTIDATSSPKGAYTPCQIIEQSKRHHTVSATEGCVSAQHTSSPSRYPNVSAERGALRAHEASVRAQSANRRRDRPKPLSAGSRRPVTIPPSREPGTVPAGMVTEAVLSPRVERQEVIRPRNRRHSDAQSPCLQPREPGTMPAGVVTYSPVSSHVERQRVSPGSRRYSNANSPGLKKPHREVKAKDTESLSAGRLLPQAGHSESPHSSRAYNIKKDKAETSRGQYSPGSPLDFHPGRLHFGFSSPGSSGSVSPAMSSQRHTRRTDSEFPLTPISTHKKELTLRKFLGMSKDAIWEIAGLVTSIVIIAAVMICLIIIRMYSRQKRERAEGRKSSKTPSSTSSSAAAYQRVAFNPALGQSLEESTASLGLDYWKAPS